MSQYQAQQQELFDNPLTFRRSDGGKTKVSVLKQENTYVSLSIQ